ncbi:GNAT family N-acetyltransferase [Streptomyces sp. NPDC086077]|uniref:GNAT family N-acetyltransferase n=1 Tax=Streptomyces sp. NPDC086077 TaxID=3154862 RepID=UPI0034163BEA
MSNVTDDTRDLLAVYDKQLRGVFPNPSAGVSWEQDGPLLRVVGRTQGLITGPRDVGVRGSDLQHMINRQRDYFAEREMAVEWRTHHHDEPEELPAYLQAAGFASEEAKTVLIGHTAEIAAETALPNGVTLRRVTADADMHRIAAMEATVWGDGWEWLGDHLIARIAAAPADTAVLVAEAGCEVVCAAWLVIKPGSDFAGLRGGTTLPEWRGRGVYRALVAARAKIAAARGLTYLHVDASDDSAPILRRLGFHAVTSTTSYVWTPTRTDN